MPKIPIWKYEQADIRDDVRTALPDGWALFVYYVTSGDSGKKYLCQLLVNAKTHQQIEFCNCWMGIGRGPLAVLGAVDSLCKHTENLKEFLRQKGNKR